MVMAVQCHVTHVMSCLHFKEWRYMVIGAALFISTGIKYFQHYQVSEHKTELLVNILV